MLAQHGIDKFLYSEVAKSMMNWRLDWQKPYLEGMEGNVFKNTFKNIASVLERFGDLGTRFGFEFECYDFGYLYNLAYFVEKGLVKPPFLIRGVFGVLGGIGADRKKLSLMRMTADQLLGRENNQFSAPGAISAIRHNGCPDGRERAGRAGRQQLFVERGQGDVLRRAGPQDQAHPRRVLA